MIGTGLQPQVVTTGDLNEDGFADLISGNAGDNTVAVCLGRGDGTFRAKVLYACISAPASLAVADLNQDGHLDVAIACPASSRVQMRFGAGDGTLGAATDHVVTAPVALVASQFNDLTDAFMDVLIVNSPTGSTLNNLRGLGGGAFSLSAYSTPWRSRHLAAGDVDHDGHADLVFANVADSVAIFLGSGTSSFVGSTRYKVQSQPSSVAIADFDDDGNPDIVAAIPGGNALNVMLGNGDGTFDPYTSITVLGAPAYVATADFNGDGFDDIAVTGHWQSTVWILISTGSGTFNPPVQYAAGYQVVDLAIGQLDANSTADLAITAYSQNSISTLPGNGNGTFQVPAGPVYVWNIASGQEWEAANWRPVRNSPSNSDVLVFNRGGAVTCGVFLSVNIGQLVISGGTQASLYGVFGQQPLNLLGGPGDDGVVEQGSKMILAIGGAPLHVNAGSGVTMAFAGDVEIRDGDNRLQAVDANGIVFKSGGRAIIGPGAPSTPLGHGSGLSGLNSVRFSNGSSLIAQTTINVFGTAAPNAVVAFDPGSRFRMDVPFTPETSGRTYADFEYNVPGGGSMLSGSNPLQLDSLIVTAGALSLANTGTVTIRGTIAVPCFAVDGALKFLPPSPTTVRLAGSARQYMRPRPGCATDQLFYLAPNVTLNVDNPAGIEFFHGYRTSASLSFTSGTINTRRVVDHPLLRYRITVDSSGTISGAGPLSGWVAAPLMRRVPGNGTIQLDIGDSISYQPVDVTLHGVTAPGYIYAGTAPQDHWAVASAPLDPTRLCHRSWSLWALNEVFGQTEPTYLSSVDARLRFSPADVAPGADPLQFVARRWPNATTSGSWYPVLFGSQTPTSIDVTGIPPSVLKHLPTFQIGNASTTDVDDPSPLAFALAPIAPNPAPAARNRIGFVLPREARVRLTVHDLQGRRIATLADEVVPAGRHDRTWDARAASSGVYFIELEVPGFRAQRRVTVLR